MPSLTVKAIWLYRWRELKHRLKVFWVCLWLLPLLAILFIVFTLWELFDKKGSKRFWDEIYADPYA